MNERLLGIYLRDHYAASAGGVALARRVLRPSHPLAREIASDRATLARVMGQLGIAPSATKVGLVRMAEVLGRLKLNGRLFRHSPLSRVVELEVLLVGIRGKEALWATLGNTMRSLDGIDFDALVESAQAQARQIEELRLSAVTGAFGGPGGEPRRP